MISAAASCYKKDFRTKIDQLWGYILTGLDMVDQKLLFKATLSCLSDIARNHEHYIAQKLNFVFSKLVDIMRHQNIDRDIKTEILKCFGDLSLGLKTQTEPYLDTILEIC